MKKIFKLTAGLMALLFAAVVVSACDKDEPAKDNPVNEEELIPNSVPPVNMQYTPERPSVGKEGGIVRVKMLWENPDKNPSTLKGNNRKLYYDWYYIVCRSGRVLPSGKFDYAGEKTYVPESEGGNKVSYKGFPGLTADKETEGEYVYAVINVPANPDYKGRYFRIGLFNCSDTPDSNPWMNTEIIILQE